MYRTLIDLRAGWLQSGFPAECTLRGANGVAGAEALAAGAGEHPEEQMSHTTTTATAAAPRRSGAQWAIVAVLAILGILALVTAILFITGAANSIHFLSGSVHHGHHQVRLTVSLVAGVLLIAAAGYFMRTTSKS
jgi:uncharacterized integral membrane protein